MLPELPSSKAAVGFDFDPSSYSAPVRPRRTRSRAIASGIQGEGLPEDPSSKAAVAMPSLGDGTRMALNAAALQTLSMKQATGLQSEAAPSVRVFRGNLLPQRDPVILDGVKSADVSYIADTRGHGGSNHKRATKPADKPAAGGRMRPHPPPGPRKHREEPPHAESAPNSARDVAPSSRAEAVATADQLRRALLDLPSKTNFEDEVALWDAALGEVVRQVYVHCNERGQLLGAIRNRYGEITQRLMRFHNESKQDSARAIASLQGEQDKAAAARRHAVESVFRFAKAGHLLQRRELEGELDRRSGVEQQLRHDLDQTTVRSALLVEQIAQLKRRIAELQGDGADGGESDGEHRVAPRTAPYDSGRDDAAFGSQRVCALCIRPMPTPAARAPARP